MIKYNGTGQHISKWNDTHTRWPVNKLKACGIRWYLTEIDVPLMRRPTIGGIKFFWNALVAAENFLQTNKIEP